MQEVVLNNYPNPERLGCQGELAIKEVAQRELPIQDSAWEHITHCSPCYQEFLGIRRELMEARRRLVRRNRLVLASVLLAAAIIGIAIWASRSF